LRCADLFGNRSPHFFPGSFASFQRPARRRQPSTVDELSLVILRCGRTTQLSWNPPRSATQDAYASQLPASQSEHRQSAGGLRVPASSTHPTHCLHSEDRRRCRTPDRHRLLRFHIGRPDHRCFASESAMAGDSVSPRKTRSLPIACGVLPFRFRPVPVRAVRSCARGQCTVRAWASRHESSPRDDAHGPRRSSVPVTAAPPSRTHSVPLGKVISNFPTANGAANGDAVLRVGAAARGGEPMVEFAGWDDDHPGTVHRSPLNSGSPAQQPNPTLDGDRQNTIFSGVRTCEPCVGAPPASFLEIDEWKGSRRSQRTV